MNRAPNLWRTYRTQYAELVLKERFETAALREADRQRTLTLAKRADLRKHPPLL
jgi:hypothetical protein